MIITADKKHKKKYAILLLFLLVFAIILINQPQTTYLYIYSLIPIKSYMALIGSHNTYNLYPSIVASNITYLYIYSPIPIKSFMVLAGPHNSHNLYPSIVESNIKTNNLYLTIFNMSSFSNYNFSYSFTENTTSFTKRIQLNNGFIEEQVNLIPYVKLNNVSIPIEYNSTLYYYGVNVNLNLTPGKNNYLNINFTTQTTNLYNVTDWLSVCNYYNLNNSEMVVYKGNTINESNIIPFSSGIKFGECQKFTNITNGDYTIVSNLPNVTNEIWNTFGFYYTFSQYAQFGQNIKIINESVNKITFLLNNSDVVASVLPTNIEDITLKNNCKNSFLYFFSGDNSSLNSTNKNLIEIIAYNTSFTMNNPQTNNFTAIAFSPNPNTKITWNIENTYYKTILGVEPLWFYEITNSQGPEYYSVGSIENPIIYNKSVSIPTNANLTNLYFYNNLDIYSNITTTCN